VSSIEIMAKAMCGPSWDAVDFCETPDGSEPEENREYWRVHARIGLTALRDSLIEKRGDPRGYGQGFYDPLGPKISVLDDILRDY
jgi:hypothetical protein